MKRDNLYLKIRIDLFIYFHSEYSFADLFSKIYDELKS